LFDADFSWWKDFWRSSSSLHGPKTQTMALIMVVLVSLQIFIDISISLKSHLTHVFAGLLEEWVMCHFKATAALQQTSNWISRVMDRITAKVIEYLHRTGAPSGQLQDSWHLALMHLVKSASSTVACPGL
jgi:hypothetical protein